MMGQRCLANRVQRVDIKMSKRDSALFHVVEIHERFSCQPITAFDAVPQKDVVETWEHQHDTVSYGTTDWIRSWPGHLAGIEVSDDFERFNQRNDLFTRAFWDPQVQSKDTDAFFASYRIEASPRRGDGFSHKDFALRNAAWAVSDMVSERSASAGKREGFQAPLEPTNDICPDAYKIDDVPAFTDELKEIAKLFGADLVGVCELDERWHYSSRVDVRDFSEANNELPQDITHVIVLGHGMDASLVRSYPSALAAPPPGLSTLAKRPSSFNSPPISATWVTPQWHP